LFSDAMRIDLGRLRRQAEIPARLLGIGLPLTIVAGTLVGLALFDLSLWEAALLAAILAPTDAALGQAVMTSPAVPVRIRQSLNVESGLNDGIALPAVTVFLALAAATGETDSWVRFLAEQIGWGVLVGIAVGGAGGWLVARFSDRGWAEGGYRQIAVLALAVVAMTVADEAGGKSFIAAFVAGGTFGGTGRRVLPVAGELTEDIGQLLSMLTFVVFGALLVGPSVAGVELRMVVYGVLSLTVVRMIPVALALSGSGLRRPTVAFVGWFGPRGLASILFALTVVEAEVLPDDRWIFTVTACTVVLSILAHGVSAGVLAARYGAWYAAHPQAPDMIESMPSPELPLGRAGKGWGSRGR
jgi:NhaP-type Na+/H+ or K+/H+ antiporter